MAAINLSPPPPPKPTTSFSSSCIYTHTPSKTISFHFTPSFKNLSFFSSLSLKPKIRHQRSHLVVVYSVGKLSETELVPVTSETDDAVFLSVAGVYDKNGMRTKLFTIFAFHFFVAGGPYGSNLSTQRLEVGVVDNPDRTTLTEAWKSWMEEHIDVTGKVPPGNEKGNTTWVRQAPKQKADLRIKPGQNTQLTVPLEELIDRMVKENKVVAFIKNGATMWILTKGCWYFGIRRCGL